MTYNHLTDDGLAFLRDTVGTGWVSTAHADREQHARDQGFHEPHLPEAVVWPETTAEVSRILRHANERRIPVTAWGAGTSLEGHPIPMFGGIVLDFRRMDNIVAVHAADFQVDVQPGVLYKDMNEELARYGLFFPPDPGANASIGGMVANNAAGIRTVKYGATRENVLALEVVLADGRVIRCGTHAHKSASGYDLVHLFTGSEGTLGIVTEATLKLAPLPDQFSAGVAAFDTVDAAAQAVYEIMGSGLSPAALELLDTNMVQLLNVEEGVGLPESPILFMEFHAATQATLEEELKLVEEICIDNGCTSFQAGFGHDARRQLWHARHRAYETLVRANPEYDFLIADVAVPISQFPEMVTRVRELVEAYGLLSYTLGHAGDGNLHVTPAYDPDDPASIARTQEFNAALVHYALELGGTATGEHGVGVGKRKFMLAEHGDSLAVMRAIKQLLDPNGILNPGKIFE
ncbi:MAG: FAD-binding oxidoreductase [Anaerolineae bacterium]